jgi:hypothetical protein
LKKKIDDKIKIKIIKIKFDIKNNLAVHFVSIRGKHKKKKKEKKKKKMNGLRSPIRAPQPTNAACGGRPW